MAQAIKFQDKVYNFPDTATRSQILEFLQIKASGSIAKPDFPITEEDEAIIGEAVEKQSTFFEREGIRATPVRGAVEAALQISKQGLADQPAAPIEKPTAPSAVSVPAGPELAMTTKQATHYDVIKKIEVGDREQPFIRTTVAPTKPKERGSTAYGPLQITSGLLGGYLKTRLKLFTNNEAQAMRLLRERQEIAIKVGGKFDRPKFEKGGAQRAWADSQAEAMGYETTKDFLDAFDYGGNYGLHTDKTFMKLYDNFSKKMLNDVLKLAKGIGVDAAAIWHGGPDWKTSKHAASTKAYIALYINYEKRLGQSPAIKGTPARPSIVQNIPPKK